MVESGGARFVIADIPGLIPGAHHGAGLGHRFLRHVERTRLLVHLLDPEPALAGGDPKRSTAGDYDALRAELAAYSDDLARRPEIVCISKADLMPDPAERKLVEEGLRARGIEPRWISAETGEGIEALLQLLAREVARR
jgi:GTP-binding protein